MQMILNSDVSGVITSIPPKSVALRGNISTAPIAITRPSAATNEQSAALRVLELLPAFRVGRAIDTVALAASRPVISPIVRTASAVITTIASGDASLRSSR